MFGITCVWYVGCSLKTKKKRFKKITIYDWEEGGPVFFLSGVLFVLLAIAFIADAYKPMEENLITLLMAFISFGLFVGLFMVFVTRRTYWEETQ